jgi:hypothetical protein
MAAGLGFKDFTTGEVLTAADVDGYLMQGVWVFASATARDAAVTSPQEGNFAYLKDTNVTTYYTGSAWANLDTTGMTNPMTTTGDTIYSSSGSTPARLGIGTAGQVLRVNSGATAPEWAAPASGGMTLLSTTTLSGATTTITISANTFNYLVFVTEQINCSNDATPQIYANGTSGITDYVRLNGYNTAGQDLLMTADTNLGLSWAGASDFESGNTSNAAVINLYNINSTGHKPINVTSGFLDNSSLRKSATNGGGRMKLAAVVTDVTFSVTAGTFNGGTVYTYGVK